GCPVADRVELAEELRLSARAVLEVDDQPVEAGPGEDLGGDRGAGAGKRPVDGLAGEDPGPERAGGRWLDGHEITSVAKGLAAESCRDKPGSWAKFERCERDAHL